MAPRRRGKGHIVEELIPRTVYGPLDGRNFEYAWQGAYLEAVLLSDVGLKRKKNEDSCLLCAPEAAQVAGKRGYLFAVADGMGGATAGEYASRMALLVLARTYFEGKGPNIASNLRSAVEHANGRVFEEAEVNPVYSGMGTTVSSVVFHGNWAYVVQVGDSRVYLLREGAGLHQITNDHSLVAEQVRNGIITEEEARNHSLRNLITRAVGIKERVKADSFCVQVKRDDTLLICSDGLSNLVSDQAIEETLSGRGLRDGTRRLIKQAIAGGGTDNITALSVRVAEEPPETEWQEGADKVVDVMPRTIIGRIRNLFS